MAVLAADAPSRQRAVARILDLRGIVTTSSADGAVRTLRCFGTVYAQDQLQAQAGSSLVLAFRGDAHLESLQGPAELTVLESGCQPDQRVKRISSPAGSKEAQGRIVGEAFAVTVSGASVLRGSPSPPPRRLHPIQDSVQPTAEPVFGWSAGPIGSSYEITVADAEDKLLWRHRTTGSTVKYAGRQPLRPGRTYVWEVTQRSADGELLLICEGRFSIAAATKNEAVAAAREFASSPDPAMVSLAALWFKQQRMWDEALRAARRLVELAPRQPAYQLLLSEVLEVAERKQEAQQALEQAEQL
jgi:hypothetical protein